MKDWINKGFIVAIAMLVAAGLAVAAKPRAKAADQGPQINLEKMVPEAFAEWKLDETVVPIQPAADVQAQINRIYNQTLARTYIDGQGRRVMLSIAYGGDQTDSLAVHLPEGCYKGQGFDILSKQELTMSLGNEQVPIVRLLAQHGRRVEPITYWLLIGQSYARNRTERKLAQLKSSLTGRIPEGILVRVSSIGGESSDLQYRIHESFIRAMLSSLSPADRKRLIGTL